MISSRQAAGHWAPEQKCPQAASKGVCSPATGSEGESHACPREKGFYWNNPNSTCLLLQSLIFVCKNIQVRRKLPTIRHLTSKCLPLKAVHFDTRKHSANQKLLCVSAVHSGKLQGEGWVGDEGTVLVAASSSPAHCWAWEVTSHPGKSHMCPDDLWGAPNLWPCQLDFVHEVKHSNTWRGLLVCASPALSNMLSDLGKKTLTSPRLGLKVVNKDVENICAGQRQN